MARTITNPMDSRTWNEIILTKKQHDELNALKKKCGGFEEKDYQTYEEYLEEEKKNPTKACLFG